jgi:O-antigen ligase
MPAININGEKDIKYVLLVLYLASFMMVQFSLNIGFSYKPYMMFSGIIILLWFASNKAKPIIISQKRPTYEVFFIIFVLYAIARNLFADDVVLGLKGSVALCFAVFVYYFTVFTFRGIKNEKIFRLICQSGIIVLTIIVVGFILSDNRIFEVDRSISRLRGYIQDPNFFALYFFLPMMVYLSTSIRKKRGWLITIISIIIMFLTYSRSAYVSLLLGTLYLLFLLRDDISRYYRKILIIISLLVAVLWLFSSLELTQNIWNTALQNLTNRFSETASTNVREVLIRNGFETFKENPIFGVGMLNVRYYISSWINNDYLHNTYLEVFVEQGIVGGVLYLGFVIGFILTKCKNVYARVMKVVVVCQLMMLVFLSALNNEALFLSMGLFHVLNLEEGGISAKPFDNVANQ